MPRISKLTAKQVVVDLRAVSNPMRAKFLLRFFKTGEGQYGEGDVFIGVTVPANRAIAKRYVELSFGEIKKLLKSKIHEHRLAALLILDLKYKKYPELREEIFELYLFHTRYINNWDLVDTSATSIVGHYIWNYFSASRRKMFLIKMARSEMLWERRIAIVATYYGIKNGKIDEVFHMSKLLLRDREDLMHKAVGWMLREAGKQDRGRLMKFLGEHGAIMPRTMLRYAIEKFSAGERSLFLQAKRKFIK